MSSDNAVHTADCFDVQFVFVLCVCVYAVLAQILLTVAACSASIIPIYSKEKTRILKELCCFKAAAKSDY